MDTKWLLLPLLASLAFLTGCSTSKEMSESLVPREADKFARQLIHTLRAEDFEQAKKIFNPQLKVADLDTRMQEIADALNRGEITSIETVGSTVFVLGNTRRADLTYQLQCTEGWLLVNVVVDSQSGQRWVMRIDVDPVTEPLAVLGFSFVDKTFVHYLGLAAGLLVSAFSLYVLLLCLFKRTAFKILWVVVILIGVARLSLNWTTGDVGFQFASIQVPWVTATKVGPYAPWVINIGFPLGAVLFYFKWWLLNRPKTRSAPREAKPKTA